MILAICIVSYVLVAISATVLIARTTGRWAGCDSDHIGEIPARMFLSGIFWPLLVVVYVWLVLVWLTGRLSNRVFP
jgi:hypothetical protein